MSKTELNAAADAVQSELLGALEAAGVGRGQQLTEQQHQRQALGKLAAVGHRILTDYSTMVREASQRERR